MIQIKGWQEHFETAESRKTRMTTYVPIPNAQDGFRLTRLLAHEDGLAAFGLFVLMVQIASTRSESDRDGYLTHDGKPGGEPITISDLALRFHREPEEINRLIGLIANTQVPWVETSTNGTPHGDPCLDESKQSTDPGEPGYDPGEPGYDPGEPGYDPGEPVLYKKRGEEKRVHTPRACAREGGSISGNQELRPDAESTRDAFPAISETKADDGFERWWKTYPRRRRQKKAEVRRIWKRQRFGAATVEQMIVKLGQQIESEAWLKDQGQFIPLPSTYLRAGQWEDEIPDAPAAVPAKPAARDIAGKGEDLNF